TTLTSSGSRLRTAVERPLRDVSLRIRARTVVGKRRSRSPQERPRQPFLDSPRERSISSALPPRTMRDRENCRSRLEVSSPEI
ncbi:hypothetical protein PFISCL1PPCAC_16734, partial [Pristionchus fissidentatus]